MSSDYGYGLWALVLFNSGLFILFAYSFFHPRSKRDWRAFGVFSGFLVALFTEMYGFPLTVYLLSGWVGTKFPGLGLTHSSGHLWNDMIGWKGDAHLSPFHLASYVFIGGGFWLIASAWRVLFAAQQKHQLATGGAYARVRHPQYAGFLAVMVGFLLQWPTLPTLAMFPVLVYIYYRLSRAEEREVRKNFGAAWDAYATVTPRFIPRLRPAAGTPPGQQGQEVPGETHGRPRGGMRGDRRVAVVPVTLPTDRGERRYRGGIRTAGATVAPLTTGLRERREHP